MSLNKVMLIGRVGKDAEVRYIKEDFVVAQFSLATSYRIPDAYGNYETKTEWHRIVVYNEQAKYAEKVVRKGQLMYAEGHLRYREYVDKDKITRQVTEIVCERLENLSPKENKSPMQSQDLPSVSRDIGIDFSDDSFSTKHDCEPF